MPKPQYAHVKSKDISALLQEYFEYKNFKSAVKKLNSIRERYITSKSNDDFSDESSVELWVRDYQVTEEERKNDFMGNFAKIRIEKQKNRYILKIEKKFVDLRFHPRRKRRKERLPNWGHPILRSVKKGKKYESIQQAGKEFKQLIDEYPETTVPAHNTLYLMVFDRNAPPGNTRKNRAVRKIILEIEEVEGYFLIMWRDNPQKQPMPRYKIHEMYESNFLYLS